MKRFWANLAFFKFSFLASVVAVGLAWWMAGPGSALVVVLLSVLEVSLSFDNAVLNASILKRMGPFWQRLFLTVGMVIAVVGMRLLFPIGIVAVTAGLGWGTVVDLAFNHPTEYARHLELAHPTIAAFGGMFLLMIFLDFLLDAGKERHWLGWIERPLAKAGRLDFLSVIIAVIALFGVALGLAGPHSREVLVAGSAGLVTYLVVGGLSRMFEQMGGIGEATGTVKRVTGRAALFLFLYLEVLDASLSFDGVVGAFAITGDVLVIALGLGVGALFIRSLTVWLVRHNTLDDYVYLEHGAHYAIGALAVLLGLSLAYTIPDVVTGLIGVAFIGLALVSSVRERRPAH